MMRLLLIQAYLGRKETAGVIFPLGLCYIASALKKHDVELFDPNISQAPYEDLTRKVKGFSPETVGISIRNIDTTQKRDIFYYYKTTRPTVRLIKDINPEIKVILGGAGYSMFAKEIMKQIPEADFGVYLEGEESFPELLDNLDRPEKVKGICYRENGSIIFTGHRELPDFSNSSIPDRSLTDIHKYLHPKNNNIGIQTKRGCLLSCAYCNYPFLNGHKLRLRTAESIVDEVEYLINNFGIRKFMFVDSVFNVPRKHAEAICREIIKRKLDVQWGAWFDLKNLSKELILLAREAGCKDVGFSPDGVTDKTLAALKKGITNEDIKRSLKIVREIKGINVGYNFFIAAPGQTFRGYLKTMFLFFKIPFVLLGRGGVTLSWIRIEPHTGIYKISIKENVINKQTNLLPVEEEKLSDLFYTILSLKYFDVIVKFALDITEKCIKPAAKNLLRFSKVLIPVKKK